MTEETFRWVVAGGVGLAALSFLVIAISSVIAAVAVKKMKEKADPLIDAAKPIVYDVGATVTALKPRILKVSQDVVEISSLAVTEAHRYSELSKDLAERVKVQIARWDNAVDDTREQVQHAGDSVKRAVLKPFHQVDAVLAGIRTAIASLANGRRYTVNRATQDEEMFI
jgi:gas vesicle protein